MIDWTKLTGGLHGLTVEIQANIFKKISLALSLSDLYINMQAKTGKSKAVARVEFLKTRHKAR